MSKYGDADWRKIEADEFKNRKAVSYYFTHGGDLWCSIRDGGCLRPGPAFASRLVWRCPCRGARCGLGGGGRDDGGRDGGGRGGDGRGDGGRAYIIEAQRQRQAENTYAERRAAKRLAEGRLADDQAQRDRTLTVPLPSYVTPVTVPVGAAVPVVVLAVALPAPRNRCPQDMVDHVALHHEEALRLQRVRTRVEAEVPGGGGGLGFRKTPIY